MIDKIRQVLAKRLRTTTLYAIARDSGIGFQSLRRWHSGERQNMRLDSLSRLASYLGLELVEAGQRDDITADTLDYAPCDYE
jgi:transcriptional regulator with XRE-family HTH domain